MSQPSLLMFGATGQLAMRLSEVLSAQYEVTALDRAACDFETADVKKISTILRAVEPVVIINATGYTAVDKAEAEPELAYRVNAEVPGLIAQLARAQHIPFLHFSTDYVFDGARGTPYTEAVPTNPLSVYGASKRAGEELVTAEQGHIFRLQWVYDGRGKNFFLTMQKLLAERAQLSIVADQIGAPSFAAHIARAVAVAVPLLESGTLPAGVYHLTAGGYTSWHGFACAIAEGLGSATCISAITSAQYPLPAVRPKDARLDCGALAAYGITMPHWREGLAAVLQEFRPQPEGVL